MTGIVYLLNNNVIELQGLTNSATSAVDVAATVTVTIKDKSGTAVTGQVWPAAMSLVSESPTTGKYRATLDSDLNLLAKREYVAVIEATGSGGEIGYWEYPMKAQVRSR